MHVARTFRHVATCRFIIKSIMLQSCNLQVYVAVCTKNEFNSNTLKTCIDEMQGVMWLFACYSNKLSEQLETNNRFYIGYWNSD